MTTQETTDAAVAAIASKATYAASAATVVAGYTVGEWAALIGIGMTIATFVANLFFKFRADRREQAEHELRVAELKAGLSD